MKAKLIIVAMAAMLCGTSFATSAFDIQWWSGTTYSNSPANTLRQWAEGMEGRVGGFNPGTGKVWYVDSGVSSAGDGTSWANAKATLDAAVNLCVADRGDVIYVAPGHAEDWTTTDSVDVDIAGVMIIGLGEGRLRPTFTYDDTDPELVLGAANCSVYNLNFLPSVTAVVHAIEIEADANNCTIDGCWFMNGETSGTDEFIDAIQPAALANDITVRNCFFETYGAAGANTAIDLTAGVNKNWKIVGNYFSGDYAEAPIYSDNDVHLRMLITNNVCYNTNSGEYGIEFAGAATGVLAYNVVYTDAVATAIDPGSLSCIENYAINTTDLSAIKVPPEPAISAQTRTAGSVEDILAKLYYAADGTGAYPATVANDSTLAKILASDDPATAASFNNTTDSLEAIADAIAAITTEGFRATCEINAGGATHVIAATLAGFGTDYFNTGWRMMVVYDAGGVGAAPEGEVRDIVDYDNVSDFTVGPAFSAAVTTGDKVMIFREEALNLNDVTILGGSDAVLYVNSAVAGTPDVGDLGKSWDLAHPTITAALDAATASGTVIYVAPGHSETLTAAYAVDDAGVSIIGLGEGSLQPLITLNHIDAQLDISVADVLIENIRIESQLDNVKIGIDIAGTGDGAHIKNCRFTNQAASDELLVAINLTTGSDDVIIEGCDFLSVAAASTECIKVVTGACDNLQIIDNWIRGDYTVAPIWSDQALTNLLIKDNVIHQETTGQFAVELTSTAVGAIVNNTLYSDAYATMLDPGSCLCSGNMGVDALDQAAIPIPISVLSDDIAEDDDGSNLERLEYLQNKVEDILAGIRMAGGSVGDVYYCDDGGSSGDGTTWATAKTTLDAAWGLATANVGDIIFVAPSHDEAIAAEQITCDTAGVTIIGIGEGAEQPQIEMQHGTSAVNVSAAGVKIKNINFYSSTALTSKGIYVTADSFTLEDCLFNDVGDFEFAISVDLGAAAENATIRNCRFESLTGTTGATSAIAVTAGVVDRLTIENCHIWGDFDNAGIYSNQINTNALIRNNSITNNETGDHAIELSAATTGDLVNNMLSGDTYGSILDPGSMRCFGNMQTVGIDSAAEDVPLIAGKSYARKMLTGDLNASDNLFSVTGSPIIVTSFVGKCTVACGGATTLKINCDADDTFDYDLSTSVDVDAVDPGGLLIFTAAAGESVLTVQAVGASGSMGVPIQWWVEEGMLESTVDAGGSTGDIEWYMIFTPVENGCEVIPQ